MSGGSRLHLMVGEGGAVCEGVGCACVIKTASDSV